MFLRDTSALYMSNLVLMFLSDGCLSFCVSVHHKYDQCQHDLSVPGELISIWNVCCLFKAGPYLSLSPLSLVFLFFFLLFFCCSYHGTCSVSVVPKATVDYTNAVCTCHPRNSLSPLVTASLSLLLLVLFYFLNKSLSSVFPCRLVFPP